MGDKGVMDSEKYLTEGGLGEVIGLADAAKQMGQPKVQMDTDMALALCWLAAEAVTARKEKIAAA